MRTLFTQCKLDDFSEDAEENIPEKKKNLIDFQKIQRKVFKRKARINAVVVREM